MKSFIRLLGIGLVNLCLVTIVRGQATSATAPAASSAGKTGVAGASSSTRTDMYHVHFVKSSLGKAAALADALKIQDPKAPMPGHFIILRHESGESWDYAMISHLGTKAARVLGLGLFPDALHHVIQIEAAVRQGTPLFAGKDSDTRDIGRLKLDLVPLGIARQFPPHAAATAK